jgi:hypothetical protein
MYNSRVPDLVLAKTAAAGFPSKDASLLILNSFTGGTREIMAKTVCKLLGVVFVLVGIAGFVAPTLLGAHLTMAHNLVHIVSGALALYFGFAGSYKGAKGFCIIFGLVYLLLGVVGWFMGTGPDHMFNVGTLLMLGKVDHIIHILLGVVFLAGGLLGGRD